MATPAEAAPAAEPAPVETPPLIVGLDQIQIPDEAFGIRPDDQAAEEPPVEAETPPSAEAPAASAPAESRTYTEDDFQKALHDRERELNERWEQNRLQKQLAEQRDAIAQARRDLVLRANSGDLEAQAQLAADEAVQYTESTVVQKLAQEALQTNELLSPQRAQELDVRNFKDRPLAEWVAAHREDAAAQAVEAFKARELPALREALAAEARAEKRETMPRPPTTQTVAGGYTPPPQFRSYAEAIMLEAEGKLNASEVRAARAAYLAGNLPAGKEYRLELATR